MLNRLLLLLGIKRPRPQRFVPRPRQYRVVSRAANSRTDTGQDWPLTQSLASAPYDDPYREVSYEAARPNSGSDGDFGGAGASGSWEPSARFSDDCASSGDSSGGAKLSISD